MKTRTLIAGQLYFGLEPLALARGAERALDRFANVAPDKIRINVETLREAFQLDTVASLRLLRAFVANKLLEPEPGGRSEYRVTERFREIAAARVVPPLRREEARHVLEQACELAARFNAEGTRNPLLIERMAVSGSYMGDGDKIGKLSLWPVVARRDASGGPTMTQESGAREIRHALRDLSPFISVQVVTDTTAVERPFSVPFEAGSVLRDDTAAAPRWWERAASYCRELAGR